MHSHIKGNEELQLKVREMAENGMQEDGREKGNGGTNFSNKKKVKC